MSKKWKIKDNSKRKGMPQSFKKGNTPWNKGVSKKLNDALTEWRKEGGQVWNKGLRGEDNPNTGKKRSEEDKKRISEGRRMGFENKMADIDYIKDEKGRVKVKCFCKDCNEAIYRRGDTFKEWNGRCQPCAKRYRKENAKGRQPKKKLQTTCIICKKVYLKHKDKIKKDGDVCRDCFNANAFSSPQEKERCRQNMARQRKEMPEKFIIKPKYGEKHWNWQGGKTSEKQKIRQSPEYKEWRKLVFERDDYTCLFCGERGGKLHADHIKPFSLFPELRLDVGNGRTLCIDCHKETDTYMHKIVEYKKKMAI